MYLEEKQRDQRLLHLLQEYVIDLRREHRNYARIGRDIRLAKEIDHCRDSVSKVIKELLELREQSQRDILYLKMRCCELGTTLLVFNEHPEEGEPDHYSMDRLFDGTFRSWRVGELKRLVKKPSSKRTAEDELALQILKGELEDEEY